MRQLRIGKQITNRESKSLDKYLNEIAGVEMISMEEESKLTILIKQGCKASLNRLVEANLRFVVSVAKQYQHQGMTLEDIINEGNVGLIKAAQRFDETRGFKFISYAVWWIRQSILHALADQARLVRIPVNRVGTLSRINKAAGELEQKYEREPSNEELAHLLEMDEALVIQMQQAGLRHISVDAPNQEDEENSLLNILKENNTPDPDYNLVKESLCYDIFMAMNMLNKREREVLNFYFGLNGHPEISLEEIGERLELTKERIRQIKDYSLSKLKKAKKSQSLKVYLG